jgi:orotate phosphoribosyltransferase
MHADIDRTPGNTPARGAAGDVAGLLVRTAAVTFRTDPFYTFTSGVESPVYVDNRRLLGFPDARRAVVAALVRAACERDVDAIAGTATAGIAWAAWMADTLDLPMMYVRSGAKRWGRQQAVEGFAAEGARTLLIEDLAFSGGSLVAAAEELQAAGYRVEDCVTIVTYDTPAAQHGFERVGIRHRSLTTIDDALDVANATGALSIDHTAVVREWLARQRDERSAENGAQTPATGGS